MAQQVKDLVLSLLVLVTVLAESGLIPGWELLHVVGSAKKKKKKVNTVCRLKVRSIIFRDDN